MAMVERMARAIAADMGDDIDTIPRDKTDWNATRGMGRGTDFRGINMPMACDYRNAARAAIAAMREPTEVMCRAARSTLLANRSAPGRTPEEADANVWNNVWGAAIDAILSEEQPK